MGPCVFLQNKNNSSKIYKLSVNNAHSFTCIDDIIIIIILDFRFLQQ